jgi:hypothetical protein
VTDLPYFYTAKELTAPRRSRMLRRGALGFWMLCATPELWKAKLEALHQQSPEEYTLVLLACKGEADHADALCILRLSIMSKPLFDTFCGAVSKTAFPLVSISEDKKREILVRWRRRLRADHNRPIFLWRE